jgi:hypothetical protein
MPTGTLESLADAGRVLESALASTSGVAVSFSEERACLKFRQRLYAFRQKERESNAKLFPPEHEAHNKSRFDHLTVIVKISPGEVGPLYQLHVVPVSLELAGIEEVVDIATGETINISEEEPQP